MTTSKPSVAQIFESLAGRWHIQRMLGQQGTMQGTAHFGPHTPGVWHYQEQGLATWNRRKISVHRAYAYVHQQDTVAVYFWDEARQQPAQLLHTLQFVPGAVLEAMGTHQCGEDTYAARYRFFNAQHFQLTYQVRGPHKHDDIQTQFRK